MVPHSKKAFWGWKLLDNRIKHMLIFLSKRTILWIRKNYFNLGYQCFIYNRVYPWEFPYSHLTLYCNASQTNTPYRQTISFEMDNNCCFLHIFTITKDYQYGFSSVSIRIRRPPSKFYTRCGRTAYIATGHIASHKGTRVWIQNTTFRTYRQYGQTHTVGRDTTALCRIHTGDISQSPTRDESADR